MKRRSNENDSDYNDSEMGPKRQKLEKPVELKGLLGNSLGSYWNDGSMMVEKRRRKQVVRFTTDDGKKEGEEDDEDSPRSKRKPRQEPVNLKKRARGATTSQAESSPSEPVVNPYQYFEAGSLDSTLNTSQDESPADEEEPVVGARKRKRHTPYTKDPISVACHMARKPVQNFNLCPYKQPSKLLRDCANFLLRDHSSKPLVLALDVTELIHVTEYKAMLQKNSTKIKRKQNQRPKDIDNLRPGYSRAKEELKQFLCQITVERTMHAQQRKAGLVDPEYQVAKKKFFEWLREYTKNEKPSS